MKSQKDINLVFFPVFQQETITLVVKGELREPLEGEG